MKKLLGIVVLGLLLSGCSYAPKDFAGGDGSIIEKDENFIKLGYTHYHSDWYGRMLLDEEQKKNRFVASEHCSSHNKFAFDQGKIDFDFYDRGIVFYCFKNLNEYLEKIGKAKFTWTNFDENSDLYIKNIAEENKINRAQKLIDNKKTCEEIGFTPQTENFANCILKLMELDEIRQAALLESKSRASLEAKIQEQATDIQNKIAEEAKASRDQKAWATLLGMTTGNSILSPSSTKSNICFKTSEVKSGLGKICYYNCVGTTKTLNIKSTQLCPLNANL